MGIKGEKRQKRALKTRSKIALTNNNRLTIFRSNSNIYAQITSNNGSEVLVSASTSECKEIFTLNESIEYFNLEGIGKSPSKLDMNRILSMNEHYIKNIDENDLFYHLTEYRRLYKSEIKSDKKDKLKKS